jgi:hypothetical protein
MKIPSAFLLAGVTTLTLAACDPKPTTVDESPDASPTPALSEQIEEAAESTGNALQDAATTTSAAAKEAGEKIGEMATQAGAAASEAGTKAMENMRQLADEVTTNDAEHEVPSATPAENVEPTPAITPAATPTATPPIDPIGS